MRLIFKIILAIIAIFVIGVVAFGAAIFLNLSALGATGSETLTPTGTSLGRALVVYDPGYSGNPKTAASRIAVELQTRGYIVDLAGVKSGTAAAPSGYSIIVAGGPIYAGGVTSSVRDFLNNLNPDEARVGVFGSGSGETAPEDIAQIVASVDSLKEGGSLADAVIVKIGNTEDLGARAESFVSQLILVR